MYKICFFKYDHVLYRKRVHMLCLIYFFKDGVQYVIEDGEVRMARWLVDNSAMEPKGTHGKMLVLDKEVDPFGLIK